MKKTVRRILSVFLVLCIFMGAVPTVITAAATSSTIQYEKYNPSTGVWTNDGVSEIQYSHNTYKDVGYSKTAVKVAETENQYDVTLLVETGQELNIPGDAAAILILDVSTSMKSDDMTKMRAAANTFVDAFTANAGASYREIQIITFCADVKNVTGGWVNVNTKSGKTSITSTISKITEQGSGTNPHGALLMAKNIFAENAAAIKNIDSKFVIMMTDGNPNVITSKDNTSVASNAKDYTGKTDLMYGSYYGWGADSNHWSTYWKLEDKIGGTNWWATTQFKAGKSDKSSYGDPSIYAAYRAKLVALELEAAGYTVYRIGYGSDLSKNIFDSGYTDEATDARLETGTEWLTNLTVPTGASSAVTTAEQAKYTAASSGNVSTVFQTIATTISNNLNKVVEAWTVTDNLGDDVTLLGFISGSGTLVTSTDGVTMKNGGGTATTNVSDARSILWDMKEVTGTGTTKKTYLLKYRVEVDPDTTNIGTTSYRLNNATSLKYILVDTVGDDKKYVDANHNEITSGSVLQTLYFDVPTVTSSVVSITTPSSEKVYDSKALTNKSFELKANPVDTNDTNKDSYVITVTETGITVTKNGATYTPMAVDTTSSSVTFSSADMGFADGHNLKVWVTGTQTNAGTSSNTFSYDIVNNSGTVVSSAKDDYTVLSTLGSLKVTPKKVTVTADDKSKIKDATDPELTATTEGTLNGDTVTYTVTRAPGETPGTYTITPSGTTDQGNYTIEYKPGTLTIRDTVPLTTSGYTGKYDGNSHAGSASSTVTVGTTIYYSTENDGGGNPIWTTTPPTITNFGEITVKVKAENPDYETAYDSYVLKVTKRDVTLTSATDSKTYDGSALTNGTVTETGDGFVTGEGASYDVTGSQTYKGSSDNTFTYTLDTGTNPDNYNITKVEGTLTVNPITTEIIITADSNSKMYDGSALTDNGYTYTDSVLLTGDELTAVITGSQTDAGSSSNVVTSYKVMRGSDDVTACYTFGTSVDGTLTVTKRSVTMTSATDTKVYNGSPLKNDTVTETEDGFITGEGALYNVTGSQTAVGNSPNTFGYTLKSGTKADNYNISTSEGTLTVTPADTLSITTNGYEGTYDGDNHKGSVTIPETSGNTVYYSIEDDIGGNPIWITTEPEIKDVGTVTVKVKVENTNYTNPAYGSYVLKVNPASLTVTTGSDTKLYDGSALTESTCTVTGLVTGETLTAAATGSQTNAGTSKNTYSITWNGTAKETNYTIVTENLGDLEVTKRAVKMTSATDSKTYDGSPLTNGTVTETGDGFVTGEGASYDVTGSQTYKGSSKNFFTYDLNTGTNPDNYTIETVEGTLTVNPITTEIIITANSNSKMYDGSALTDSGYTYTDSVLLAGDELTAVITGSQTDAGTSSNVVTSYKVMRGSDDVTACYTFGTSVDGTLTVTKRNVTMTSGSSNRIYDGTPLKNGTVTETGDGFATGEGVDYNVTGSQIFVGKSDNTFTYTPKTGTKAENYNISTVEGELEVTPITSPKIVITADSNIKVYDGTELTDDGFTYTGGVLKPGDILTAVITGTITDVGTVTNVVTSYKVMHGLNDVTDCYTFDPSVNGTLEITPITSPVIVITASSGEKIYDGSALTNDGYTYTLGVLVEGDVLTAVVSGSQTDFGTSANTVTSYNVMRSGTDVTSNYTFGTSVDGTLTVKKRDVKMTSATDSKTYDGSPLVNHTVTETGSGFVTGEGAEYNVTGTRTSVGSTTNTFSYNLKTGTNPDNYVIETVEGTLTVNPVSTVITITANSNTKKYDGSALTDSGYTYTDGILKAGDVLTAEVEGTQTNAGSSSNVVTSYKVMRGDVDVTDCYTFGTCVDGTLTVTKRDITMTSATDSKTYDGSPLTNGTVTETEDGFITGEGASYDVTGSQTYKGSSNNFFTYTLNAGTNPDNYNITKVEGTLTVNPISTEIIITANSNSKMYDGSALTDTGYTYTDSVLLTGDELTAVVTGSQTDAGNSSNVVTSYKVMRGTDNVTDCYTFGTSVDGTLTVTKRNVTMTSATDTKVYNGSPLTNGTVTETEDGFITGEGATYNVTGSQTAVGDSPNTFGYKLNIGTKAENYNISKTEGTLTVTPADAMIIETSGYEGTYDGDNHKGTVTIPETSGNTVYYSIEDDIGGDPIWITTEPEIKDVGTVTVKVKVENINYANPSYGSYVLKVNPAPLTVTTGSDTRLYDALALTESTCTVTGLVTGETLTATATGSQTNAGKSTNTYSLTWDGTAKETNYTIVTENLGELEVTKRAVKMTSATDSKTYDGTPLTNNTVTETGDGFATGEGASYNVTGSQTYKGSSNNFFTYDLNTGTNPDNYTIETAEGTLTVNPISTEIIITANSNSKMYNATALTDTGYTYTDSVLLAGDELTAVITGSQTNAGNSSNVVTSYKVMRGDVDVTECYTFGTSVDGTLTVTKRNITMTSATDSKTYDSTPLTNSTVTETGNGFAGEEGATYDVTGSQTYKGSSDNTFTYTLNAGTNPDNYDIETVQGTLTVNPVATPIIITANSNSKTYDGTPLTDDGFTYTEDVIVLGEELIAEIEGEQTNVGSTENVVTGYKVMHNDVDVTDCYTFGTPVDGVLTVNPKPVTVTADKKTKIVGEPDPVFTAVVDGTVTDADKESILYTVSRNGTEEDEGTYDDVIVPTGDVNQGNYIVTYVPADFEIQGLPLVLTKDENDNKAKNLGEDILFTVKVENINKVAVENLTVTDPTAIFTTASKEGLTVSDDKHTVTIASLAAKTSIDLEVKHTVTEEDILLGYKNEATLTYKVAGKTETVKDDADGTIKAPDPKLYIKKESKIIDKDTKKEKIAPANVGDAIEYTIVVLNQGNLTLSNVKVVDALVGLNDVITTLVPNQYKTYTKVYVVDENDVLKGKVTNIAAASADPIPKDPKVPDGEKIPVEPVDSVVEDKTITAGPRVLVTKAADQKQYTDVDEVITYTINVVNIGNMNLSNAFVIDDLTNDTWFVDKLNVGETRTFVTTYKIKDTDINKEKVVNTAQVSAEYDPKDPEKHVYDKTSIEIEYQEELLDPTEIFTGDHISYIIGYPDGNVRPNGNVTRAEATTIFFRLLSDSVRDTYLTEENPYSDVSEKDWFNRAISTLSYLGIVNGYPDGSFRPNQPITRGEMSTIISKFNSFVKVSYDAFNDIEGHWAEESILRAAENGWVNGYLDGSFKPDQNITRAETVTMVNRMLKRIPKDVESLLPGMTTFYDNLNENEWYYIAIQESANTHTYTPIDPYEIWNSLVINPDWIRYEK